MQGKGTAADSGTNTKLGPDEMSAAQACKALGISLTTLRAWTKARKLKVLRTENSRHGPRGTQKKIYARAEVLRAAHADKRNKYGRGLMCAHVFSLILEGRAAGQTPLQLFRQIVIQTGQEATFIRELFRQFDAPPGAPPPEVQDANDAREEEEHEERLRAEDESSAERRRRELAPRAPPSSEDDARESGVRTGFRRQVRMSRAAR